MTDIWNFFARRAGYPHFKSKRARQSLRYPQPKAKWITADGRRIYLPKIGHVRVVMHRPLAGEMKNVTVSRTKSGRYFVSLQVEVEIDRPIYEGGTVGIDLGLRDFLTLSSGVKMAPPQHYRKAQQERRQLARQVSRKKLGSRRLSKSIGDAGWSAFIGMLAYKGDWYGCRVEKVSRWCPSSKTYSACGTLMEAMPLHISQYRDVNAALNILSQSTVGVTGSHAWGQPPVRPDIAAAVGQRWMNQDAHVLLSWVARLPGNI